ncbi:MAG: RagB/SusD family nutrient uptake outer membrane protein [Bacteroides sp.]|uniref:RagB/SusD family nutrient uptake outer membrane protein n=1 Tax=Bacteroides sp. TaxID=29523 RepID=UPI0026E0B419|nr:RagB/SusD family nutrient uptake outer membrane protein [Bacteroides sp.]MDO5419530.1 RagB/SusD family nutrient uptake outer membrane protein [Bacteroides sp.]
MKKRNIFYSVAVVAMSFSLGACDDFLDKMPDNRATMDSDAKITSLLVSAYPTTNYALLGEMFSDNTDCNGLPNYSAYNKLQEQAALWEDITEKEEDSPYNLWNSCYMAIAAANQALEAIETLGLSEELKGQRGEALMCRAYAHWVLVNIFCKNYSPKTSTTDLGIPYVRKPETVVSYAYERGTVADVYREIEVDLQEALPLMNDAHLNVPKYHFNKKAAYAFACRFYLFYVKEDKSNYDKVIEYAQEVLGDTPAAMLRDWKTVGGKAINGGVRAMAFVDVAENANLLLYSTSSIWARTYGPYGLGTRYTHNQTIGSTESCAPTPWGTSSRFYFSIPQYSGLPKIIMAKMAEYFEYTDPVNGIGNCYVMYPALTSDEVILNRAEAYVMKGQYDKALADLNTWAKGFYRSAPEVTAEDIQAFYGVPEYDKDGQLTSGMVFYTPSEPTPKKAIHPDFVVETGKQECFVYALLHLRRILMLHEGNRWFDIKRYGIEIYRRTVLGNEITVTDEMKADDPRHAIQLPQSVITAGIEANPR